jgi:hypothetical protein
MKWFRLLNASRRVRIHRDKKVNLDQDGTDGNHAGAPWLQLQNPTDRH